MITREGTEGRIWERRTTCSNVVNEKQGSAKEVKIVFGRKGKNK